jgi:hypothetical protein
MALAQKAKVLALDEDVDVVIIKKIKTITQLIMTDPVVVKNNNSRPLPGRVLILCLDQN